VVAEPRDEIADDFVPPHPRRESLEARERIVRGAIVALVLEIAIDTIGVRPIAFDADGSEVFLENQSLRDGDTLGVELVCPVGRFADQDKTRVSDELEERVVVMGAAPQRLDCSCDRSER
jgi:hypothetical protein